MNRKLTRQQTEEVVAAYAAGESISSIAQRYGIATSTPWKLAKKAGIKGRQQRLGLAAIDRALFYKTKERDELLEQRREVMRKLSKGS